jgi:hypothetical protein
MPVELTRRTLFNILPAATAGCAVCAGAFECAAQTAQPPMPAWSQNSDMTYEQVFRFAYQKDLIPILKSLAVQIGREKFTKMLQDTVCDLASKGMAGKKLPSRDFATFLQNMKSMPPLYRAAMDFEVSLAFENINRRDDAEPGYGVDHIAVAEAMGCKAIRVRRPEDCAAAFEEAKRLTAEHQVPVVVEFILERVTNISMGTEIDAINEFEELATSIAAAPTAIGLLD